MIEKKLSRQEITDTLWRRGSLLHKCHSVQREMYETFYNSEDNSTLVWLLSRQTGKSTMLAILAIEHALRKKNGIIKVLTDTKIHMENIFIPIMNELLEECPADIKPEYNRKNYTYVFLNGSQIQLAGSDAGNFEKLRGQKSVLCLVDEAGFCNSLSEVVRSVLIPTTTHTGGKIVLASTPPVDYDHDFIYFIEEAELKGLLTKKTIYDNPLLSKTQIERLIKEMGGETSEQFRREYLCELIKESSRTVIPEATDELMQEIVKEWPRPLYYDTYVSMDLGYHDLTIALFAYYDFKNDVVVIEDELTMHGSEKDFSIKKLTESILKKESDLWLNKLTNEVKSPLVRVSDINYIVTNEIAKNSNYQITFQVTKKDDKATAINNLRAMLGGRKVIINPKCVTLIRHLKNAKWRTATNKKEYARSPDEGHYDGVDAGVYLLRNIVYSKNPYPIGYDLNRKDLFISNPDKLKYQSSQVDAFRKVFRK